MKEATFLLLVTISTISLAQRKSICVEAGFRYNLPEQLFNDKLSKFDEQKSGFGFELMPKWNLSNTKSIGINLGFNLIAEDARTDDIGAFEIFSYVPTFKHQLLETKFSPFYSLGFGGYSVLNSRTSVAPGISINLGTTLFRKGSISFEYNQILTNVEANEDIIYGFDNWNFFGMKLSYDIEIK